MSGLREDLAMARLLDAEAASLSLELTPIEVLEERVLASLAAVAGSGGSGAGGASGGGGAGLGQAAAPVPMSAGFVLSVLGATALATLVFFSSDERPAPVPAKAEPVLAQVVDDEDEDEDDPSAESADDPDLFGHEDSAPAPEVSAKAEPNAQMKALPKRQGPAKASSEVQALRPQKPDPPSSARASQPEPVEEQPPKSRLTAQLAAYERAQKALKAGAHDEAAGAFGAFVERWPDSHLRPEAELSWLEAKVRSGKLEGAVVLAQRLAQDPDRVRRGDVLRLMADALAELGRCAEADFAFRDAQKLKARRLGPADVDAALAACRAQRGPSPGAR